jgi:hypothetical protein
VKGDDIDAYWAIARECAALPMLADAEVMTIFEAQRTG